MELFLIISFSITIVSFFILLFNVFKIKTKHGKIPIPPKPNKI